jgi:signal transduction histidine kinase
MLCFIDISQKILYDTSKAEGEFLSLINSTISHEMRNPLNSIINQCKIDGVLCQQFQVMMKKYREMIDPSILKKLEAFQDQMFKGNEIQTSSSNLLLLNVEDILGFAQLKAGKFTKIIKKFNIKRCIEEIISIQYYQAKSKEIELISEFYNFPIKKNLKSGDSEGQYLLIESDEKRIKQVLMNL